jgi:multicomponent K+:H+ antiporter subunit D
LVHGGGAARARGGLHYVVVNLVGSTLFLFALALIYGTLGTLNLADVAGRLPTVPESDQSIVIVGLTLLMVVFAIKAAIAPLSLWLPRAYPVALPAVGALFAVMTKVGIYAMVRVSTAAFESAPYTAGLLEGWLFPFAIASIALGVFGLFASARLGEVAAHLVLISSGTLGAALAIGGERMISAIVFYLPHTVLCTSALFLVIGAISQRRGACEDRLERGAPLAGLTALGLIFLLSAVALSGLPPLSGFLGKWILMNGAAPSLSMYVFWAALILSGFASALVLARSGSRVFWEPLPDTPAVAATPHRNEQTAVLLSAAIVVAVTVLAQPIDQYARATAAQLGEASIYQRAVLPDPQTIVREGRP